MKHLSLRPRAAAAALLAACLLPLSGHAELFTSLASSAGSSASSASDSIGRSSGGPGRGRKLAEGEYRVVQVADVAGQPDKARLTLRAADGEFLLTLPRAAQGARALAVGDRVQASPRPYGVEFARAETREAFFLVLDDAWARGLDAAVPL
ncbi:hypothetical protein [Acidovorax sp. NCPPB 4044]|uniref:hypothetical protein n=1 Tax=Acidovorax sp. NCPPB 4044 TaxID=2940490 RepID=UPI00230205F1|nr:hypothetical protein [Acidovorax sp. NCPPB 4044]MDA8521550.1 hypothetical protein [Acidovorax sp. NCPPB 4044]